jgi:NhaA family Na+:H+ antiporter
MPRPSLSLVLAPFQRFFATESAGGIVLLVCAALALAWANSPWSPLYEQLWHASLTAGTGAVGLTLTLHEWVNDGLMAVFFLLVGLEIKREVLVGELATRRSASLPIAAALGGMVVPALVYVAINAGGPGAPGWGIPMATDIAFALGILALLGDRIPTGLKVFLAALAIADDLGAVLVIALFYTDHLALGALAWAGGIVALLIVLNRMGTSHAAVYVVLGGALWVAMLASGIHATVAGVLLAFTIPARTGAVVEHALHGVTAFVIVPLFALANAGVPLAGGEGMASPIALGVLLGLVVGKPLGILLASWLAVRAGVAELPQGVSWRSLSGAGWLGGIGFTMSLFIAGLAFGDARMLDTAKIGILAGSFVAGIGGWLLLRGTRVSGSAPPLSPGG